MELEENILIDEEGTESEEDLGLQDSEVYSKAVIWGTDWTAETIVSQLKKKNIDLNPDFQRRDAWDRSKKSKFIESLILGLPVPPIILAERKDRRNSFLVIDGKQRLLTIMQFCAKEEESDFEQLYLRDLEILPNLNKMNYSKMQADVISSNYTNQFDNQTIRTVVIRNWPSEQFLYTVFLRLNTGSLKLSPQELRQALHPGEFLSFVNKYAESDNHTWEVLRLKKPDARMRDVELILRYFAFKNFLDTYGNSLKDFLDNACQKLNSDWEKHSDKYKDQLKNLEAAIDFTTEIFGPNHRFRRYIKGEYSSTFNRAIFDIMVYFFSKEDVREKLASKKAVIKSEFEKLMTDNSAFINAASSSAKDKDSTNLRFRLFGEAIESTIRG